MNVFYRLSGAFVPKHKGLRLCLPQHLIICDEQLAPLFPCKWYDRSIMASNVDNFLVKGVPATVSFHIGDVYERDTAVPYETQLYVFDLHYDPGVTKGLRIAALFLYSRLWQRKQRCAFQPNLV
jgi:hypothetical protein